MTLVREQCGRRGGDEAVGATVGAVGTKRVELPAQGHSRSADQHALRTQERGWPRPPTLYLLCGTLVWFPSVLPTGSQGTALEAEERY